MVLRAVNHRVIMNYDVCKIRTATCLSAEGLALFVLIDNTAVMWYISTLKAILSDSTHPATDSEGSEKMTVLLQLYILCFAYSHITHWASSSYHIQLFFISYPSHLQITYIFFISRRPRLHIISNTPLESAVRPAIHPKSTKSGWLRVDSRPDRTF